MESKKNSQKRKRDVFEEKISSIESAENEISDEVDEDELDRLLRGEENDSNVSGDEDLSDEDDHASDTDEDEAAEEVAEEDGSLINLLSPKKTKSNEFQFKEEVKDNTKNSKKIRADLETKDSISLKSYKTQINENLRKEWIYTCTAENCLYKWKIEDYSAGTFKIYEQNKHNHEIGTNFNLNAVLYYFLGKLSVACKSKSGVPKQLKSLINEMIEDGNKPKRIQKKLAEKTNIERKNLPTHKQLKNYCYNYKKKQLSELSNPTHIGEYQEWVKMNSNPSSEKDLIVLDHLITTDSFILCFSSQKLLRNVIEQSNSQLLPKIIFADCTYKLVKLGFGLMVCGTQNISHNFKPIAFALSLHEDSTSYQFFFNSIAKGLKNLFQYEFTPSVLIIS